MRSLLTIALLSSIALMPTQPVPARSNVVHLPVHPRFEFVFKGTVDPAIKAYVRDTVERAVEHFTGGQAAESYVDRYVTVYGRDSVYSAATMHCGEASYQTGSVQLYLASGCWDDLRSIGTRVVTVHEVFHVLQGLALTPPDDQLIWFDDEDDMSWFLEGAADVAAVQAVSDWGQASYEWESAQRRGLALNSPARLEDLVRGESWRRASGDSSKYELSFHAVEHLAGPGNWQSTLEALRQVVRDGGVPRWDEAFESVYGMPVSRFYRDFATYFEAERR